MSTTCRTARSRTSRRALDASRFRFEQLDCRDRRAAARVVRRLRRDRAPRRGEDPALRRRAEDARGQRRRRQRGLRRRAGARTPTLVIASTSDVYGNAQPPFARGRQPDARPADDAPLGVRRLEALRRARRARPRGGARPARHDPAPLRLLRPAQPPELVGRPAGGVHRDPARRRAHRHPRRRPPDAHVHVRDDTVDGFVRALDTPEARGEILNIGGREPTTILELAELVQEALGHDRPAAGALRAVRGTSAGATRTFAAGSRTPPRPHGCSASGQGPPRGRASRRPSRGIATS